MDCGYSLEPPQTEAVLACTQNLCFGLEVLGENKKNIRFFHLKTIIFTTIKIAMYCIGMFS